MQSGLIPKQPASVHSIMHAEAFMLTFQMSKIAILQRSDQKKKAREY